jgi:hypothetical protein
MYEMKKTNRWRKPKQALRRCFALSVAVLTLFGQGVTGAFAASYSDTESHWGAAAIEKWSGYDVLHGNGDGSFAPDRDMSVAELATVLTNAFGYTETGNPSVSPSVPSWGQANVKKAVTAGVIASAETGLPLTRELAAKIIANAFGIEPVPGDASFADAAAVSSAYKPYVNALGAAGLFKGDTAGNFMPKKGFTRAEIVQVFDNAITDIVRESKAASSAKSVLVNAPGLTLSAGTVNGDLIIGQGVGDGDVTLDGVTVKGRLILYGGGADSVHVKGNSVIPAVLANKVFGASVRLSVESDTASVGTVSVVAESKAVVEGNVAKIEAVSQKAVTSAGEIVSAEPARETSIEIKGGEVGEVSIEAADVALAVSEGSTVASLNISNANASVTVASGATVTKATVAASDVMIEGEGKLAEVTVTAESEGGVTVAVSGTQIKNESGASVSTSVTVGAGDDVAPGAETPSTPSGGGGGGGNSGNNVVDRSDTTAKYGSYNISISHLADLTFVVVEPVSGSVASVAIVAGGKSVPGVKQNSGQYRAVLDGNYGLSEIAVTITP